MEVKRVKLEIKKGLIIRDPVKKMAHEGECVVTLSTFWRRRINEGDAKVIEEVKANQKPKSSGQQKSSPLKSSNKNSKKSGGKE